ncbi:MAG: hypothetical protein QOI63_322, partial [Thermoplasmata archaeon]|nr:hypothetical protein [Thermoplasmata archaeon]
MAAAACLLFGALVLAGGPRRRPNQLLALFLLCIAGNQAIEAARVLAPAGARLVLARWAAAFAVADPLALYAFAAASPPRSGLARPSRWVPLAVAAAALLAWAAWMPTPDTADARVFLGELALAGYTAVAYLAVWRWALRQAVRGAGPAGARLLYPALCCAALPVVDRVGGDLGILLGPLLGADANVLRLLLWLPLALGAAAVALRQARGSPRRGFVLRSTAAGVLLMAVLNLSSPYALLAAVGAPAADFGVIGRGAAAVRWLLFGALV